MNSNCSNILDLRNLQLTSSLKLKKHSVTEIVLTFHCLNKYFCWSQKFCKFLALNFKSFSGSLVLEITFPTHSIFTLFFSSLVMTLTFRMILKERKLLNSQEKLQIGDQTTCFTHVPMLNLSNCLWVNTNIFLTFPADF